MPSVQRRWWRLSCSCLSEFGIIHRSLFSFPRSPSLRWTSHPSVGFDANGPVGSKVTERDRQTGIAQLPAPGFVRKQGGKDFYNFYSYVNATKKNQFLWKLEKLQHFSFEFQKALNLCCKFFCLQDHALPWSTSVHSRICASSWKEETQVWQSLDLAFIWSQAMQSSISIP